MKRLPGRDKDTASSDAQGSSLMPDSRLGESAESNQLSVLAGFQVHLRPALLGLLDGVCFQRCNVYTVHNHQILVKLGHCVGLNGGIYLGSMAAWSYVVSPACDWVLRLAMLNDVGTCADPSLEPSTSNAWAMSKWACGMEDAQAFRLSKLILATVFAVTWLLPVYLITFPLSCMWYQQIADLAHKTDTGKQLTKGRNPALSEAKQDDVFYQLAQELYRVVLFGVFFLQTSLAGYLPVVGFPLEFVLLSWLNALYSFDYKWSLSKRPLEDRVKFFEQHWGFFAGFGSVCTLLSYGWARFSQYAGIFWPLASDAAFLAMVYPLFILIASQANPQAAYSGNATSHEGGKGNGRANIVNQTRLPIFQSSIKLTSLVISWGPDLVQWPKVFWKNRWKMSGGLLLLCLAIVFASSKQ